LEQYDQLVSAPAMVDYTARALPKDIHLLG